MNGYVSRAPSWTKRSSAHGSSLTLRRSWSSRDGGPARRGDDGQSSSDALTTRTLVAAPSRTRQGPSARGQRSGAGRTATLGRSHVHLPPPPRGRGRRAGLPRPRAPPRGPLLISDTVSGLLTIAVLLAALAAVHVPLGSWMARVFTDAGHWRVERLVY